MCLSKTSALNCSNVPTPHQASKLGTLSLHNATSTTTNFGEIYHHTSPSIPKSKKKKMSPWSWPTILNDRTHNMITLPYQNPRLEFGLNLRFHIPYSLLCSTSSSFLPHCGPWLLIYAGGVSNK
jgi:hypothetical protein